MIAYRQSKHYWSDFKATYGIRVRLKDILELKEYIESKFKEEDFQKVLLLIETGGEE